MRELGLARKLDQCFVRQRDIFVAKPANALSPSIFTNSRDISVGASIAMWPAEKFRRFGRVPGRMWLEDDAFHDVVLDAEYGKQLEGVEI